MYHYIPLAGWLLYLLLHTHTRTRFIIIIFFPFLFFSNLNYVLT